MIRAACLHDLAQAGIEKVPKLRVLYMSNNKVKEWNEVERLAVLPALEELLMVGNPIALDASSQADYRLEVRHIPTCSLTC